MKPRDYYVVSHFIPVDTYRLKQNGKRALHTLQPQQLLSPQVAKAEFSHLIGSKLLKIVVRDSNISTIRDVKFLI